MNSLIPVPNFDAAAVEWINNFIPDFIMDVIIYSDWNISWSMLVKAPTPLIYIYEYIYIYIIVYPAATWQNDNVIIASKRRRDVILT